MKITYLRKATKEDTVNTHFNKAGIPKEIQEQVENNQDIGSDVVAVDIVMSELTDGQKKGNEAKRLDPTLKYPFHVPEFKSCTLMARFGGYPGEYSVWSVG